MSLETDDGNITFFRELSQYYVRTRYPEEVDTLARDVTDAKAKRVLVKTEELVKWLQSEI
jgi:HEPN domain-containing protein